MKIEMKTHINYEDCTRIIQGLNTLEKIWEDTNMLNDCLWFDREQILEDLEIIEE